MIDRSPISKIITLIAIIAAFGVNVWANIAPINGLTIGEISNTIFQEVLITPANYAFIIWGIIYLGLISFAVYQLLATQSTSIISDRTRYLLSAASLAQILWVIFFLNRWFVLSLLAMVVILICLVAAYLHLSKFSASMQQKWLVKIPISIYTAWISVATIVNGATLLDYWNWNGWGIPPQIWTCLMLLIAGLIGAAVAIQKQDLAYVGVFIWALVAIAVRNSNEQIIVAIAVAIVAVLVSISIVMKRKPINRHL